MACPCCWPQDCIHTCDCTAAPVGAVLPAGQPIIGATPVTAGLVGDQAAAGGQQFELVTELLRFVVPPGAAEAFLAAVRRPGAAGDAPTVAAAQLEAVTLQPSTPPKEERQPKGAGVRWHSLASVAAGSMLAPTGSIRTGHCELLNAMDPGSMHPALQWLATLFGGGQQAPATPPTPPSGLPPTYEHVLTTCKLPRKAHGCPSFHWIRW